MTLNGQRIIVLGGTSGIGLAVAKAAAAQGASVVVASSRKTSVDRALGALPPTSEGHVVDLAAEDAIKVFFDRVGAFDHLVFTAGENMQLAALADQRLDAAR